MTNRKIFIIISLTLIVLANFRLGWIIYHKPLDQPQAANGVIDLSNWKFDDKMTITLDGEWFFYPNEFLDPTVSPHHTNRKLTAVPGDWTTAFKKQDENASYGFGTYYLKILLPEDKDHLYGIRFKHVSTAAEVYVNGERIKAFNRPSKSKDLDVTKRGPFSQNFHTHENEAIVMVHVSNFEDPIFGGGITKSVKFGRETAISKEASSSRTMQLIVSIIYLLHSMYAFILFFLGKGRYQREVVFYGAMLLLSSIGILIDDDIVVQLPFPIGVSNKILLFIFNSTLLSMIIFTRHLFDLKRTRLFKGLIFVYSIITIGEILLPIEQIEYLGSGVFIYYTLSLFYLFTNTIKVVKDGHPDSLYILLFLTSYTSNILWGTAIKMGIVDIPYYPFEFIFSVVVIAFLLFKRHIRIVQLTEKQSTQLQIADKKKDEFLANTSHELRNPLHGVINIAQTVLDDKTESLSELNRENLQLLIKIGQRMSFTLNDLLDITRLQDQSIQLNRKNIDVEPVAAGVLDMIYFTTEQKDIDISLEIPNHFPYVNADKNRLIQILFNLIHNAVKYTEKGSITIGATHENGIATIFIADTGIGMNQELQQQVFQPYVQADSSLTSVGGGIGLGLTICKQLIELHGGTIYVESILGEGSTFYFTLPIAADAKQKEEHIAEEVASTYEAAPIQANSRSTVEEAENLRKEDAPRILVVDDDPVNLRIIKNILVSEYEVITAMSGKQALELLEMNTWDLVITDVMMPQMSGYELTEHIRKQYSLSELPILILTARNQFEDIYSGFVAGANDYIAKTMNTFQLKPRVRALTNLKQAINEQLRTEAAWLQAQIQPHFLYNTLNTIASLGEMNTTRMVELLHEFGNYLRRSFDVQNRKSLIPLGNELDLIKSYLFIEKERFGERLEVKWVVPENIDVQIPPLSLQPVVENAVRHGVLQRMDGGTIWIKIFEENSFYQIHVIDNGVGMSKEKINHILYGNLHNVKGVGLANTNRRLKQLFGKGLEIQSKLDEGTTVILYIPKK
ncbi:ATP-binding protein [Virgibacillus sp. LDC-1]|uniref:hybrid sensor histidine kinase/response regulator n=1 Tax=Virgibacillus sp. LDC-1 TaxID=3039856 RepID=UPI0024DE52DB|nr:ATP-binding protein [Virgibacillus sp. LDC-1]